MNTQKILLTIVMLVAIITVFACTTQKTISDDIDATGQASYDDLDTIDDEAVTEDNNTEDESMEMKRQSALAAARADLTELRNDIENEQYSEAAAIKVAEIRDSLREAYIEAEGEAQESWEELDGYLETLEMEIRQESNQALATLDKILEEMQVD